MLALDRHRRFESHLLWTGDIGAGQQHYLLRLWNNFLYFTTAPQGPETPVWSCLRPVAGTSEDALNYLHSPGELLSWWRNEVEANKFGVLSGTHQGLQEWGCVYIWGCDGSGQLRPWWDDREGEAFEWPAGEWNSKSALLAFRKLKNHEDIWFRRWELVRSEGERKRGRSCLSEAENAGWRNVPVVASAMQKRIYAREVLPRHRVDQPLSWRRGNEAEAIALASAIAHLDDPTWKNVGRLEGNISTQYLLGSSQAAFRDRRPFQQFGSYPKSPACELLMDLLVRQSDPVGWEWGNDSESLYATVNGSNWFCKPYEWTWSISTPSNHERMEALLMVTRWLGQLVEEGIVNHEDADLLLNWPGSTGVANSRALAGRLFPSMYDSRE
jgi:hypothetical protein